MAPGAPRPLPACLRQMAATVRSSAGDTCLSGTHNICRLQRAFIRSTLRRSERMHFRYEWCTGRVECWDCCWLVVVVVAAVGWGGDYSVSSCAQSAAAVCQQHPEPCEPLHGCREMINGAETCRLGGAFGLIKCFFLLFVFFSSCRVELPLTLKVVLFANYPTGWLGIIPTVPSAE